MELTTSREGSTLIAHADGRIDGANADEFHEALQSVISHEDQAFVLDFENVSYISSAGLRVLLITTRDMTKARVRFCVCSLTDSVSDVFIISGFDKIVDIKADLPSAIQATRNG